MKALILLATLKRESLSNTQVLCEFFTHYLEQENIEAEMIRLVDHTILPGTYTDMGSGDKWPLIFNKIKQADILIFATPVWWGNHSSQMQIVFERLDEVHDEIMKGKTSQLYGKAGGIIVTGGSDGAEHIIANISNFYNAMGVGLPPYATLTVLWEGHAKGEKKTREELMEKYTKEYESTAQKMVKELKQYAENTKA